MARHVQASALLAALALTAALLPGVAEASPARTPATAGRLIVTLEESANPRAVASEYARRGEAAVDFVYETALNGFAGSVSDSGLQRLQADDRVSRIEPDGIATASATQPNAPWGLDRSDQRHLPLDTSYDHFATGAGVTAYVIDTGIDPHDDFGNRLADGGYSAFTDGYGTQDCNGHGTHVAGTIGGTTSGIAKDVVLVSVRVLNCQGSGTWSGVIAGIDWVTQNGQGPAVANMSLGGGASSSVDDAVRASIVSGVTYAVAAGNSSRDACNYSPARVAEALTVGATDESDTRASFSNYGRCLDLFAPGVRIISATHDDLEGFSSKSGTSMAAPHVAGVAAQYLQTTATATPADVGQALVADGTTGVVGSAGRNSPDVLLHSRHGETVTEPDPEPEPGTDGLTLSAGGYKVRGVQHADLTWSGATSTDVDVYRDGTVIATTANDGATTDLIGAKGPGSYTYRVCEAGTSTCSADVIVSF